jgi:hypothetical protein
MKRDEQFTLHHTHTGRGWPSVTTTYLDDDYDTRPSAAVGRSGRIGKQVAAR